MEAVAVEKGFVPRFRPVPGEARALADLRERAFARFEELGFPTPKNEAWKYTGIQPMTGTDWKPERRGLRILSPLPAGVRARPLAEALLVAEPHLAKIAGFDDSAFAALNTALFDDAVVLEIERGVRVAEPIALSFGGEANVDTDDPPEVSFPRILILAGAGSQAAVVETWGGADRRLSNAVTEIALDEGAILEHTKLQTESDQTFHVHTLAAHLARDSRFTSHNVAFGGAIARTDLHVALAGEGAECHLYGLYAGRGRQHLDNHTVIDHVKPHCTSRELYKGILDGASRGVFHGKIIVRPDAQKTDAIQTNKNLILSREALVNSTPALEILADDVKCKHGSTTGQLDAAALFYLRSRGIGEADARALLTYAFAADVAERITVSSVRRAVERELGLRLGDTGEPLAPVQEIR
jgi:Fe-S cluster assembly protein SufD